ncbi:uncharacterized protein LOC130688704 isoform X2 [Daphnia carinata]|uniref:uncharacterized protein LOC130688704 isoform X2 n=1 Tax=Daphnia carinata TaxID=120202 RepID=UPI00257F37A3|nr:uncharacterized protein LOC130688704 isoform X2 [Daphnia carinata]
METVALQALFELGSVATHLWFAASPSIGMISNPAVSEVTTSRAECPEIKRKGRALLLYDLKHPKLVPIKFLTFIILSGIGVLFPFVTIHMKSLGMTVEETGAIFGVSSVAAILTPFLVGLLADRIGNFKILMSALYASTVLVSLSFLLVPIGRISKQFPMNMTLAVGCNSDQVTFGLADLDAYPCQHPLTNESLVNVSVVLEACGYVCSNNGQRFEGYEPDQLSDLISLVNVGDSQPIREFRDAIFLQNDRNFESSCTQMPNGEQLCITQQGDRQVLSNGTLELVLSANSTNGTDPFSTKWIAMDHADNFLCGIYDKEQKIHGTTYVSDVGQASKNQSLYHLCYPQCIFRVNRTELCSNMSEEEAVNPLMTFWVYLLLRIMFEISLGGLDLFVGAAMAVCNEVGGDYGFQRMFGYIGIGIFSPISGVLIDTYSTSNDGQGNVTPAFFLFAGLYTVTAFGLLLVDLKFKPPSANPFKDLGLLLKNIQVVALLVIALVYGTIYSFCANYLFLFLQDIGGTRALMGLSSTVQSVIMIPLLLMSDYIFRKLGHPNVQTLGLSINFIRLLGYSYLYDPRLCLLLESLDTLCFFFGRTSQIAYANELGTLTTVASTQGLLGAITFGLGLGLGSVTGSLLIGSYGQRLTFRIMASVSLVTGILYFIFNLRFKNKKRVT